MQPVLALFVQLEANIELPTRPLLLQGGDLFRIEKKIRLRHGARIDFIDSAWLHFRTPTSEMYIREPRLVQYLQRSLSPPTTSLHILSDNELFRSPEIIYQLEKLMTNGVLCHTSELDTGPYSPFWESIGRDLPSESEQRNRNVLTFHYVECTQQRWLELYVAEALESKKHPPLEIVVTANYLSSQVTSLVQNIHARNCEALLVRPFGPVPWIGPHLSPSTSPCIECLCSRLRRNLVADAYLGEISTATFEVPPDSDVSTTLGLILRAQLLQGRELIDKSKTLSQALLTLDPRTLITQRHVFSRLPNCELCGIGSAAYDGIQHNPFMESTDQWPNHPEDELVDPLTGIMGEIRAISDPGWKGIHIYTASLPFVSNTGSVGTDHTPAIFVGGKGSTAFTARSSAFFEGIERYSGLFQKNQPAIRAAAEELVTPYWAPNALQSFSESQFANRDIINASCHPSVRIPKPWTSEIPLSWSHAWSLTRKCDCLVPTALAYFSSPFLCDRDFCISDSNGSAAAPTLLEAVLEGILEVIERDAAATWWYNRLSLAPTNPASLCDSWSNEILTFHHSIGRDLHLVQLPTDFPVTIYAAISNAHSEFKPILGLGCEFDPVLAAKRALAEVNQKLPVALREFDFPSTDPVETLWEPMAQEQLNPLLIPNNGLVSQFQTQKELPPQTLLERIAILLAAAEDQGIEILTVNQTRPDIAVPVAKVFMPGMRPIWPRLASGRLYDLPVRLGLRTEPATEGELMQIPLLI